MSRIIIIGDKGRDKVQLGVNKLADAVKVTLGPKGRNAVIWSTQDTPVVTKDGVSVAKEVELDDPVENMGAQLVKEVASKVADAAGDGTTTATVLTQAIYNKGLAFIEEDGANPMEVKEGIDKAASMVIDYLKKMSKPINSNEELAQIATISANGDNEIGYLISDAMDKVGRNGIITVEPSKSADTYVDITEGMQFDKGLISRHFMTDKERLTTEFDNPLILITEDKISNSNELMPVLEIANSAKRPLLIIADDLTGDALSTLEMNAVRGGGLQVAAVKSPGYGDRKRGILEDLAVSVGAVVASSSLGKDVDSITIDDLGSAQSIHITQNDTMIIGGEGSEESIQSRAANITTQIETTGSEYDKEKLQERLAKLTGGVAVIKVGGSNEIEVKEKKDRVDDALHATRAAVEEGIVPGGGTALLRSLEAFDGRENESAGVAMGVGVVMSSIKAPFQTIVTNSGKNPDDIIPFVDSSTGDKGYDARAGKMCNLIERGIIDPVKVTIMAVKNASSIAGLLLTTETVIVQEKPEASQQQMMM